MKIGFLGDIIFSDQLTIDDPIMEVLHSTNFNVANLEAPYVYKDLLEKTKSAGLYQKSEDTIWFDKLNVKAVSLANNHIGDFGNEGIRYTKQILTKKGINCFGAGMNIEEAIFPTTLTIGQITIDIWGFMLKLSSSHYFAKTNRPGVAELKEKLIKQALRLSHADIKIVFNHWNQEFEDYPEPICKTIAESLSAEANLIVGSHPHCIQGYQNIKDNYIYYSLGNFSMPNLQYHNAFLTRYPTKCYQSFILIVSFQGKKISHCEVVPFLLNEDATRIIAPDSQENNEIHEKLKDISNPLALNYKTYRKFYAKNKLRKLRPILSKNRYYNTFVMLLYRWSLKLMFGIGNCLATILSRIGIKEYIKRRSSKILNYLLSNK